MILNKFLFNIGNVGNPQQSVYIQLAAELWSGEIHALDRCVVQAWITKARYLHVCEHHN